MTERGLKGVGNPSALFLSQHSEGVAGSAVVATLEGSRPLLVEVQALVDPVQGGMPRRLAVGLDPQRLALLLAVLHRHGGVETGGLRRLRQCRRRRAHQRAGGRSGGPAGRPVIVAKQAIARAN